MTDKLCDASTTWLAAAVRSRSVSSVELVDAYLARIEQVNPRLNAVVQLADDARDQARRADVDLANGVVRGPLHGVPFTLKDSLDTAGVVTTAGTVGWRDRVPDRDATVVARLKSAGAVSFSAANPINEERTFTSSGFSAFSTKYGYAPRLSRNGRRNRTDSVKASCMAPRFRPAAKAPQ